MDLTIKYNTVQEYNFEYQQFHMLCFFVSELVTDSVKEMNVVTASET